MDQLIIWGPLSLCMPYRRPNLKESQIDEIIRGLFLRLEQLIIEEKDEESARIAYQTLVQLSIKKPGRPEYLPLERDGKFDWFLIDYYVNYFKEDYFSSADTG